MATVLDAYMQRCNDQETRRLAYCKALREVLAAIPLSAPEPLQEFKRGVLLKLVAAERVLGLETICAECGKRFNPDIEYAGDSALANANKCLICCEYTLYCLEHHDFNSPPIGYCFFCKPL